MCDGGKIFVEIGGEVVYLLFYGVKLLYLDMYVIWINFFNIDYVVFGNDGGVFVFYDCC